jgi:hypothetical protein
VKNTDEVEATKDVKDEEAEELGHAKDAKNKNMQNR